MFDVSCWLPGDAIKLIFVRGPSIGARLLALSILAFVLIFAGQRLQLIDDTRSTLSIVAAPFFWLADIPSRLSDWRGETWVSRKTLLEENRRLDSELLLLKAQVQKMASLSAENVRLRELLNSSTIVDDTVVVAELIGVSPDPTRHFVLINKGVVDGVYVGQPIIDSQGLVGQIDEVNEHFSRVLLITDSTHAVPVQVNRNGLRAMAEGTGLINNLTLSHVPATADIRVGDLLVSSGLGQRFPAGYPVATVTEVTHDPGQPFAIIKTLPRANLDRSRYVLLVFSQTEQPLLEP